MKMSDGKGLVSLRGKWLLWVVVLAVIMFSQATMAVGDDIGIPSTGLLCISNCATCPLICSPPPVVTSLPLPPPPPEQFLPPQSYYVPQSPPPPPPLQYSYFPLTPPPPPTNYPMNTPFAPSPPYNGPHDYSYPYYFFYGSKAACLSLPVFFSYFLVPLLCWSLVFPFW